MILTDVDLGKANTMRLPCIAAATADIVNTEDLKVAIKYAKEHDLPLRVLGGGSNVLLPERLNALVLRPRSTGIEITQHEDFYRVSVAAGENWHAFVTYLMNQGVHGLENLALIPGMVGASVIQNIGAYGVEVSDYLEHATVFDMASQETHVLDKESCELAYRDSRFKREPNRYFVEKLSFKLPIHNTLKYDYPALKDYLKENGVNDPTAKDIFNAVVSVRQSKLPDPDKIPNCGSFFKNPIVSAEKAHELKQKFPEMPQYPQANGDVKLAAGWLIEQCGWKGKGIGPVSMYEKQALVMVNLASANLSQLSEFWENVRLSCNQTFQVNLEIEPTKF